MVITPLKYESGSALYALQPVELSKMPNPMRYALLGIRGGGIETDYHNHQVVAAWRYLPDLRFGMVVKKDADEAFASLQQQRIFSLTALLLADTDRVRGRILFRQEAGGSAPGVGERSGRCGTGKSVAPGERARCR